jgi:hypothetical protein
MPGIYLTPKGLVHLDEPKRGVVESIFLELFFFLP